MKNTLYIILFIIFFTLTFPANTRLSEYSYQYAPSKEEMYWLVQNIYHESRGESDYGQLMVAVVTINRFDDGRWGSTIKKVVTAPAQFSWYEDNISNIPDNKKAWDRAKSIALIAIEMYNKGIGERDVMFYRNDTVSPYWLVDMELVMVIGKHLFYKEKK